MVVIASTTSWTCSSNGTPSSSAPRSMSSRLTARANALSFIFFLNDAGVTLAMRLSGRTSATAEAKPVTSSTA